MHRDVVGIDTCIVLGIRRHIRIGQKAVLDGLGRKLRVELRDDLDAFETALDLGRRRLDLDLAGRQDDTELVVRQVNFRKGKDDRDLAIGLGILRTHPAVLDVARRVLDGIARGVDDGHLFRLAINARQLILGDVQNKASLLALGTEIRSGAVLPRALLHEAGLLFIKLDRVAPGGPAINLETNRVGLDRAFLFRTLFEHAALGHQKCRRVSDGIRVLGAEPLLLLGKTLLDGPLVEFRALAVEAFKLRANFDFQIKLLVLLDGSAFERAVGLDVPLLAHVARRRKLRRQVTRRIDPDKLALAIRIDLGSARAEARDINLLKGNVITSDRRHLCAIGLIKAKFVRDLSFNAGPLKCKVEFGHRMDPILNLTIFLPIVSQ